jgi:hypothetical protein
LGITLSPSLALHLLPPAGKHSGEISPSFFVFFLYISGDLEATVPRSSSSPVDDGLPQRLPADPSSPIGRWFKGENSTDVGD